MRKCILFACLALSLIACQPERPTPVHFTFGTPVMFTTDEVKVEIDGQIVSDPAGVVITIEGQTMVMNWNVPARTILGKDMVVIINQELVLVGPRETVITIPKGTRYDLKADGDPINIDVK